MHYHHTIFPMISYMILQKSYVFDYDINDSWYYPWHHGRFHTKMPMMSMTRDINAVWYHIFHDILAHIMAPGRRYGGGWERHRDWPAAPPYWIKLDAQQIYRLAIQVVQSAVAFRTRPPRLRVTQSGAPGRPLVVWESPTSSWMTRNHEYVKPSLAWHLLSCNPSWPLSSCFQDKATQA